MYVCVCNGIKDSQVRSAAQKGAGTVGQVFKAHGCKPDCAQCVGCMRDVLEDELTPTGFMLAAE